MILRNGPTYPSYPRALIHPLGPLFPLLPLKLRRHLLFLRAFRRWGNFSYPTTFREKMQWRILNDHRTLLTVACDKLATRELVRRTLSARGIASQLSIPQALWIGTNLSELQQHAVALPHRWVLKPNHSSGRVAIIDSSSEPVQWDKVKKVTTNWLKPDEETRAFGHFGYRGARKLLIAEERIGMGAQAPDDIRCVVFNGQLKFVTWSKAYGTPHHRVANYGPTISERYIGVGTNEVPVGELTPIDRWTADTKAKVIAVAEALGSNFEHIRVDLYVQAEKIWFSELTAYSTSGLAPIEAAENLEIGGWWQLPDLNAPDPREPEWRALLNGTPKGTLQR
jgi:hypothetical protein